MHRKHLFNILNAKWRGLLRLHDCSACMARVFEARSLESEEAEGVLLVDKVCIDEGVHFLEFKFCFFK